MPQASTIKPSRLQIPVDAVAEAPASPATFFAMLSDRGRLRHANQDACGARPEHGAFVVCDGMGGVAGGEVASRLALHAFLEVLESGSAPSATSEGELGELERIPPQAATAVESGRSSLRQSSRKAPLLSAAKRVIAAHPRLRLAEAIQAANQAVYRHAQRFRSLRGMGTTLVGLLLDPVQPVGADGLDADASGGDKLGSGVGFGVGDGFEARDSSSYGSALRATPGLWLAHVGDSRCYRFRAGVLQQLTQDHSLVEEQIQAGLLSRIEAGSSPIRNIITRAIGSMATVEPEIAAYRTQPGELYLLASDGLTRELEDEEISRILSRAFPGAVYPHLPRNSTAAGSSHPQAALEAACQALVDAANARGGHDNITVVLVYLP